MISYSRRSSARLLAAFAAGMVSRASFADEPKYPSRPIRLLVGAAPGSGIDVFARVIGEALGAELATAVVIENQAGAGGVIAMTQGAKATPDGYTITFGMPGPMLTAPALYAKLPYDVLNDFSPVGAIGSYPNVLYVPFASGFSSVTDLVAAAKASPGKLTYGSYGIGSSLHLAAVLLQQQTGIDILQVPYKTAAARVADLIAGRLDFAFDSFSLSSLVEAKQLRALATTGSTRSAKFPDVPPICELGFPSYEVVNWCSLMAPKQTSADVVQRLDTALEKVLGRDDVRHKLIELLDATLKYLPPAEVHSYIAREQKKWAKVIADANIKLE